MGKKPTKCKKDCLEHRFILKPINYRAYLSKQIVGNFCNQSTTSKKYKNLKNKTKHCFPKFLNDKKYYTPAFTLKEDQNQYIQNDRVYFVQHLQKVQSNLISKSQIMQAKPRSKNDYCSVCKICYLDYIQHIQSQSHKRIISSNKFNFYIQQLCDKFSGRQFVEQKTINQDTSFFSINSNKQFCFKQPSHNRIQVQNSFDHQNLKDLKKVQTQDTIMIPQEGKNNLKYSFSPIKKCIAPLLVNYDIMEKNQLNTHFPPSPKKNQLFTDTEQKIKGNFEFFGRNKVIENTQKDQYKEKIEVKHLNPILINSKFTFFDI